MAIYFQGAGGALVIIFRDLGSKLIVLGIRRALQKCIKKSHLKRKSFIYFDFFKSSASGGKPPRPPNENINVFTFVLTC